MELWGDQRFPPQLNIFNSETDIIAPTNREESVQSDATSGPGLVTMIEGNKNSTLYQNILDLRSIISDSWSPGDEGQINDLLRVERDGLLVRPSLFLPGEGSLVLAQFP